MGPQVVVDVAADEIRVGGVVFVLSSLQVEEDSCGYHILYGDEVATGGEG